MSAWRDISTAPKDLGNLLSELLADHCYYGDSYGVDGSNFDVCAHCGAENGAGVMRHPFEHAPDRETLRLERELESLLSLRTPPDPTT